VQFALINIPRGDRFYPTTLRGRNRSHPCATRHPTYVLWVLARVREDNPDLGAIVVADSLVLNEQNTAKAVFAAYKMVFVHIGHRSPHIGQSPRKPLCHASGTGGSNPPSPLRKAKNGCSGPGRRGRVLASFGRVWGQVGGKHNNTHWCQTDRKTLSRAGQVLNAPL
jgi:hypothetical protein